MLETAGQGRDLCRFHQPRRKPAALARRDAHPGHNGLRPFRTGLGHLDSGDLLVVFTDGVTEAENERQEEYGEPRLLEAEREPLGSVPKAG